MKRVALAWLAALAGVLAVERGRADDIRVQPLDEHAAPAPDAAPAQPLPRATAVCVDRAARRCWSAASADGCRSAEHPAAEVFREIANAPGAGDPGAALRACWDQFAR